VSKKKTTLKSDNDMAVGLRGKSLNIGYRDHGKQRGGSVWVAGITENRPMEKVGYAGSPWKKKVTKIAGNSSGG